MRERIEIDHRKPHVNRELPQVRIARRNDGTTKVTIDGIDISNVIDDLEVRTAGPAGVFSLSINLPAVEAEVE